MQPSCTPRTVDSLSAVAEDVAVGFSCGLYHRLESMARPVPLLISLSCCCANLPAAISELRVRMLCHTPVVLNDESLMELAMCCCCLYSETERERASVVCVKLFSSGLDQLSEDDSQPDEDDYSTGLWGFVDADILKEVRRAHRLVCVSLPPLIDLPLLLLLLLMLLLLPIDVRIF